MQSTNFQKIETNMSSFYLLQYSAENRETILGYYGRTPASVSQDIECVKEWLKKQPHLPEIAGDKMIENFLIKSKFHIEKVKKQIEMYYIVPSLIPEFFDPNPNDVCMQRAMDISYNMPLPKLSEGLYRVVFALKLRDENPDNFDPTSLIALSHNYIVMRLREDCNLSVIYIYDMENVKPGHVAKVTPTILKKIVYVAENVLANRLKCVHIINAPTYVESFVTFVKTFFKPKLADRFLVHKTMDTFYEKIDKKILPRDYGGEEMSLEELKDEWKKTFQKYDDYYKHIKSLKVDMSLRPGKPLENDILGIQGNFRKLELD